MQKHPLRKAFDACAKFVGRHQDTLFYGVAAAALTAKAVVTGEYMNALSLAFGTGGIREFARSTMWSFWPERLPSVDTYNQRTEVAKICSACSFVSSFCCTGFLATRPAISDPFFEAITLGVGALTTYLFSQTGGPGNIRRGYKHAWNWSKAGPKP